MLDVRLVQLAQNSTRNNGAQLPQSMGVFNVAAEAESVLNANQALVQQIISSGLASPTDYLAILGILVASGQVSNSPLAGGIATFGGSLTNCTSGITSCSGALSTYALRPARRASTSTSTLRSREPGRGATAPGRRRGGYAEAGREISDPDIELFERCAESSQHSGADGRRQLQQPFIAGSESGRRFNAYTSDPVPGSWAQL